MDSNQKSTTSGNTHGSDVSYYTLSTHYTKMFSWTTEFSSLYTLNVLKVYYWLKMPKGLDTSSCNLYCPLFVAYIIYYTDIQCHAPWMWWMNPFLIYFSRDLYVPIYKTNRLTCLNFLKQVSSLSDSKGKVSNSFLDLLFGGLDVHVIRY